MTTMLRDTHNMPNSLRRCRRKRSISMFIVHFLPKVKPKERTDINSGTSQKLKRNALDGYIICVVE
jgi:hypothetical protein